MVNMEGSAETSGYDIQAVSRAAQICALFGPHTVELTAVEVATRLELNRTTAYRYCMALVAAGILERSPRRGAFILGGLMLQLGIHALSRRRVVSIAPPYLAELSGAVRMTAVLSLWAVGGPVATLVEEDRKQSIIVTVRPGSLLEATAAQTQVFLAYLKDPHAAASIAAGLSAAQRAELDAAIYNARRHGYSIAHHPGGLFGVAVPVFDEYGIAATVALLGADRTADLSPGSPILTRLTGTAAALSDELGGGQEGQQIADLR
ncbi:helix-turn-helix domain-containing protein [Arthrobacter sp. zg-Y20]|uniref:IclR family transcriptional regulator n=1 Tax=unclassified Arthrobacter TaxID=235627 RepID=UPI001D141165|nr:MULTISPECIES: helix-turn-helix domain-containing protein [unclassified Arthrobacter]MCC3274545.1 helix-turn-helix domain-containing protein [Arthrobacter sp. zg-Y20]MDK1314702.1 helix-turn-helix domain-containing protein [Arthrobacter sp. zg.Y20]WIB07681.1 helix-turn-helix domain-containing protein [Arthrobacter sp. zg-Y20]